MDLAVRVQNVVKRAMKSFEYPLIGGITGHVFETGDSLVVNDVLQDHRYRSIKGWQAGSEMCVAIREGEKILGIVDVESSSRNAFTHNDFIAMESLAGILASVITSADQYQRLQIMISQLRSTQVELRARMEAQRSAENRLVQAAKLAAVTSACFHQVVQTGRTPGTTVVHKPWVATWVLGLVAAQPIDVSKECPNGVATVETQMSFPNAIATILVGLIYDPRDVKITCAQGRASLDGLRQLNVAKNATAAEQRRHSTPRLSYRRVFTSRSLSASNSLTLFTTRILSNENTRVGSGEPCSCRLLPCDRHNRRNAERYHDRQALPALLHLRTRSTGGDEHEGRVPERSFEGRNRGELHQRAGRGDNVESLHADSRESDVR